MRKNGISGYLTIYVSLSLTVMISLCLALIGGAVRNSVRLEAEYIADIGLNSVLAEYHREVFEQYNLFLLDTSYGSTYPSYYNTEARLTYYLEQNVSEEECTYFSFLYKDLLNLKVTDVFIQRAAVVTDNNGVLFRKKAVDAILDDVGFGLAEQVLDWVAVVENNKLLESNLGTWLDQVNGEIDSYVDNERPLNEEQWITVDIVNPVEHINEMRAQGILKWVLNEPDAVSGRVLDLSHYISSRKKRGEMNRGNYTVSEEISAAEKILCHEYMLHYSGHFGQEKEESLLRYQTEYLLGGKESDVENLSYVANVICGIREAANVMYLYGNKEKKMLAETVAAILSAAVTLPELEPLFETALILGWAYVESLYDVKLLLAGGKVPLLKDEASWHFDLDSILESVDMQLENESQKGITYTDYLRILLYLTDTEKITFRFMDLMEMDIRQTKGNEAFRIDGCIDNIEALLFFESNSGYTYELTKTKKYK